MARSYSNSRIGTFRTCPRQFKFLYIEKASVEKPVSVEAFLGDAVHRTLEKLYTLKLNGRVQPLEEMLKFYHDYWEGPDRDKIKVTREYLGIDDYIKVGAESLTRYHEKYSPFDDGDVLALEKNINFPLDPAGLYTISGIIDRISLRSDGVVEIVDYKTKAFLPTQKSLDDDDQMGLYQMGVRYLWPDFRRIELKQIFLRQGTEMKAVMDDEKLEEIRYRTYQRILEIEQATKADDFPPHESAICDWCIYFELCPAKRHKLALEGEIEAEFDATRGKDLAQEYLELNAKKKELESKLDVLKEEIVRYCEKSEVTNIAAPKGSLIIQSSQSDAFPTKTDNSDDYLAISQLTREAGLEECFKLDQNALYKEFYAKEKLPKELAEKLRKYLIKKRRDTIKTYYKGQ